MPIERGGFYWEVLKVLQANGFSKPRARVLYLELEQILENKLVAGRLHLRGLLTVHVSTKKEQTYNGWTGNPASHKFVVRAGAHVGVRLKQLATDRAKFADLTCPLCDRTFVEFEDLRHHMVEHET